MIAGLRSGGRPLTRATIAIGALVFLAACGVLGRTPRVSAQDLAAVRAEVERTLPREMLAAMTAAPPLVFRRSLTPKDIIYNTRVDGVVLLASTASVATGVLVSDAGDIVTNDHIVQHARRVGADEWIAVWFRPRAPAPAGVPLPNFVLARVVQREPRHDLARLRLVQPPPDQAVVIPLGAGLPDVGKKVWTIGHPNNAGWTFGEGTVADIRPTYQWRYADGVPRSATAIEVAARIATGNSGGPVFDERGAMIGVVLGSATQAQSLGYAVAVQHVRDLLRPTARP